MDNSLLLTYTTETQKVIRTLMPGPCRGKNLLTTLVTDYIPKRGGDPGLFFFEYNLLSKLLTHFYYYMHQALSTYIAAGSFAKDIM